MTRALLSEIKMEVRQDTLRALLVVLQQCAAPEELPPLHADARDDCRVLCLEAVDLLLAHMQALRDTQAAALLAAVNPATQRPDTLLLICDFMAPAVPANVALIALRIFCRLCSTASPQVRATRIFWSELNSM